MLNQSVEHRGCRLGRIMGAATRTDAEHAERLSKVFAALADPTRRDIVTRLTLVDATVNELAAPYDVSLQAVSKHVKVLEEAGLVTRTRDAQRRPVHLDAEVFDLMSKWVERYRRQAEERYRRLDDLLRTMPQPDRAAQTATAQTATARPETARPEETDQEQP